MSWISTRAYYERINKFVQKRASPMASPPLLIESLDYAPVAAAKNADDWDAIAAILVESARRLETAGAERLRRRRKESCRTRWTAAWMT